MKTDRYETNRGSLETNEHRLPVNNVVTRIYSLQGQNLINQPIGKIIQNNSTSVDNKIIHIRYVVNSYAEFFSGYCAACTSITLLFPLNKLIFRQMIGHSHSIKHAFVQIKSEGIRNLYRGLLPPLLQKSTSYSIMFGTQNEYYLMLKGICDSSNSNIIKKMNSTKRNILLTSISGGMAGLTEAILTPFERVQALLQIPKYHDSYRHTWHVFQDVTKAHGFKELYRGMSAICMRNAFSNSIFFSVRIPMKEIFPQTDNKFENSIYDFINGALIGAIISTLFYPLNVVKSNMQAKVGGSFPGISKTFMVVYEQRDRKLIRIFKGVGGNFTRALLAWGITNSVYELILSSLKN